MRKDKFKELKESLYNYTRLAAEKNELEIRYQELKENIGLNSINYSNEGKSYNISDTTGNKAINLVEQKEKLHKFIKTKGFEVARIENALNALSEREREIIEGRYMKKRSWEAISANIFISSEHCRKIARKSLNTMYNIINYKAEI